MKCAQVPAELRTDGVTVSFLNADGNTEKWEFSGGSWAVSSFEQVGAKIITGLKSEQSLINGGFPKLKIETIQGILPSVSTSYTFTSKFRANDTATITLSFETKSNVKISVFNNTTAQTIYPISTYNNVDFVEISDIKVLQDGTIGIRIYEGYTSEVRFIANALVKQEYSGILDNLSKLRKEYDSKFTSNLYTIDGRLAELNSIYKWVAVKSEWTGLVSTLGFQSGETANNKLYIVEIEGNNISNIVKEYNIDYSNFNTYAEVNVENSDIRIKKGQYILLYSNRGIVSEAAYEARYTDVASPTVGAALNTSKISPKIYLEIKQIPIDEEIDLLNEQIKQVGENTKSINELSETINGSYSWEVVETISDTTTTNTRYESEKTLKIGERFKLRLNFSTSASGNIRILSGGSDIDTVAVSTTGVFETNEYNVKKEGVVGFRTLSAFTTGVSFTCEVLIFNELKKGFEQRIEEVENNTKELPAEIESLNKANDLSSDNIYDLQTHCTGQVAIDLNTKTLLRPLQILYNSMKYQDEFSSPLCDVMQDGDNFGHVAAMCFDENGYCYVTYYTSVEPGIMEEGQGKLSVRLVRFKIDTPKEQEAFWVAKYGETYTIDDISILCNDTFDPCIAYKEGKVYCYVDVKIDSDSYFTTCVRIFDVASGDFSDFKKCRFKANDDVIDFVPSEINKLIGDNIINGPAAIHPIFNLYEEQYYTSVLSMSSKGCIIKTTDFVTFEYVSHPTIEYSDKHYAEAALYINGNIGYYAARTKEKFVRVLTYNLLDGTWKHLIDLCDCMTRPTFVQVSSPDGFHIVTSPSDRGTLNFFFVTEAGSMLGSVYRPTPVDTGLWYPNFVKREDGIYCVWSNSRKNVYVGKITIPSYYTDNVSDKLRDLFGL